MNPLGSSEIRLGSSEIQDELHDCVICDQPMKRKFKGRAIIAQVLNCGHSYCSACIDMLWKQECPKCPECRSESTVRIPNIAVNRYFDELEQRTQAAALQAIQQPASPQPVAAAAASSSRQVELPEAGRIPVSNQTLDRSDYNNLCLRAVAFYLTGQFYLHCFTSCTIKKLAVVAGHKDCQTVKDVVFAEMKSKQKKYLDDPVQLLVYFADVLHKIGENSCLINFMSGWQTIEERSQPNQKTQKFLAQLPEEVGSILKNRCGLSEYERLPETEEKRRLEKLADYIALILQISLPHYNRLNELAVAAHSDESQSTRDVVFFEVRKKYKLYLDNPMDLLYFFVDKLHKIGSNGVAEYFMQRCQTVDERRTFKPHMANFFEKLFNGSFIEDELPEDGRKAFKTAMEMPIHDIEWIRNIYVIRTADDSQRWGRTFDQLISKKMPHSEAYEFLTSLKLEVDLNPLTVIPASVDVNLKEIVVRLRVLGYEEQAVQLETAVISQIRGEDQREPEASSTTAAASSSQQVELPEAGRIPSQEELRKLNFRKVVDFIKLRIAADKREFLKNYSHKEKGYNRSFQKFMLYLEFSMFDKRLGRKRYSLDEALRMIQTRYENSEKTPEALLVDFVGMLRDACLAFGKTDLLKQFCTGEAVRSVRSLRRNSELSLSSVTQEFLGEISGDTERVKQFKKKLQQFMDNVDDIAECHEAAPYIQRVYEGLFEEEISYEDAKKLKFSGCMQKYIKRRDDEGKLFCTTVDIEMMWGEMWECIREKPPRNLELYRIFLKFPSCEEIMQRSGD